VTRGGVRQRMVAADDRRRLSNQTTGATRLQTTKNEHDEKLCSEASLDSGALPQGSASNPSSLGSAAGQLASCVSKNWPMSGLVRMRCSFPVTQKSHGGLCP